MESRRFSIFWPLLFIAIGLFLFFNNIGAISGSTWDVLVKLWPLLLIVGGLDGIWRREGFVGSTVVIALGVVFLLGNLGYLQFGSWEMVLRLWPIFLVALGLDILIGRKNPWSAVVGVGIGLLATAGIVWLMLASPIAVQIDTQPVSFPKAGAVDARGTIALPVGKLAIAKGAAADALLDGQVALGSTQTLRRDHQAAVTPATFEMSISGFSTFTPFGGGAERQTWDLKLNEGVVYDLTLKTAVGEQDIDLSGLKLKAVTSEMAVGKQVITLPASGGVSVKVQSAVGEVILYVPRGVGVKMRVDKALTALDAPADYRREGNMLYSPGVESTASVVDVTVHNAIGRISVQMLP